MLLIQRELNRLMVDYNKCEIFNIKKQIELDIKLLEEAIYLHEKQNKRILENI